jgi:formylglycine-generating enzyme required for sulfatase activity
MLIEDSLRLTGTVIADKYRVDAVVAEGGMAFVYRATHILWDRRVALKVFKVLGDLGKGDKDRLVESFIREGALLADLSVRTASICQARDVGMLQTPAGESIPFIVLEWLEGQSLEHVLEDERARALPPRTLVETLRLLEPAAEALALAHRLGIVHRDIKPANLFLLGDPRGAECPVKLLDFGIAKVVMDAQEAGRHVDRTGGLITAFTPAYAAPEQFSRARGATGPWTDVFSLAMVLVECLLGRPAVEGDDFLQMAFAAGDASRRPTPGTFGVLVSDAVEQVFEKALAVAPEARFGSVGELWSALRVASGESPLQLGARSPLSSRGPLSLGTFRDASEPDPSLSVTASAAPVAPRATALWVAAALAALALAAAVFVFSRSHASPPVATQVPTPPPPKPAPAPPPPSCPTGMIYIPGGQFFMGSDDGLPLEKPSHNVKLAPFCIDTYEVTTDRYLACSDAGKCKRASATNDFPGITRHDRDVFDPLCNVQNPSTRGQHPINCVDWERADTFCRAEGGRLPTEAEWEFAARGPDGRKYPWGDEDPNPTYLNACGSECVAWGKDHRYPLTGMYAAGDGFATTAPVGSFPAGKSRYGLMDVVGNVWEWVGDWYAPYGSKAEVDPAGPSEGKSRVIRGGAWNGAEPSWVRPTFRFMNDPASRSYGVGFRCAAAPTATD